MVNKVIWLDVVIFEDNTFELEAAEIEIEEQFKKDFNNQLFLTEESLDQFFGDNDVIYNCDKFLDKVKRKYDKPFKCVLLDDLQLSQEMCDTISNRYNLAQCGGYINKINY